MHLTLNAEWEHVPLGADHPLAEPARRRRRVPAHAARRVGSRRPRRGAQGVPGPDRAGDLLGLRRLAPRQPHGHDAAPRRLLRRVPRARRRLPPPAAHGGRERRAPDRLRRTAASPSEEGVVFPDHFVYTHVGSKRAIERTLFDLRPGVTEMYLHPAIDTDELRVSHPDWAQRVEDHAYLDARRVVPRPRRAFGRHPHRLPRAPRAATTRARACVTLTPDGARRAVHARDAGGAPHASTS